MKVTRTQIEEAMKATTGNVLRAARILGLARNNLYKRMANLGMSPESYRGNTFGGASMADGAHAAGSDGVLHATSAAKPDSVSGTAIFTSSARVRKFPGVSTAIPASEDAKPLRVSRSIYLRPDQIKALDDACLDLAPVLREKLSPSKVLERYLDSGFAEWVGALQRPAPEKKARRKGEEK